MSRNRQLKDKVRWILDWIPKQLFEPLHASKMLRLTTNYFRIPLKSNKISNFCQVSLFQQSLSDLWPGQVFEGLVIFWYQIFTKRNSFWKVLFICTKLLPYLRKNPITYFACNVSHFITVSSYKDKLLRHRLRHFSIDKIFFITFSNSSLEFFSTCFVYVYFIKISLLWRSLS